MLIRGKQLAYLIGYSEAHAFRVIKKLKEKYNLAAEEKALPLQMVCKHYSINLEYAEKRLGLKK